jgi:SAM-dependent methyltransferase
MTAAFSDRRALQESAYADDAKLSARQAIYRFIERPWPSDGGRVLGAVSLRGDERVVDVGCGNGNDLRDLVRAGFDAEGLVGCDLSVGMLRTVVPLGVPVANADAGALPLATGSVDVALAMHMLYHCPDVAAAVAELRRVVRRGGALVVSTNSATHLLELGEAWMGALSDAGARAVPQWGSGPGRFSLEGGGEVLATAFTSVELQRTENRLLITEVEPVVAYIESVRALYGVDEPGVWEAGIELLRTRVAAVIDQSGAFVVSITKGVFVCR